MSEKLTVKNVVNINKSTLSAKDNWSTLKYLDTGNITENQIDTLQIFQKGEKLPSRAKRKVEKGTIIYSTVRPNQKHFGYFDTHSNDLVVSTGFATLDVIDPRINSKYLYYLLTQNSVISQLQSIGENSTSSYPSIRPEDIGNLSFVFPDIDIQNKIADILTSIDKKIQINNQINQELEAMAKTLYDYWFVQFDFPDQNAKPYKSSGGKMVYHPELKREIPEGWGVEKLENLGTIVGGSTPTKSISDNFTKGGEGYSWITPNDLSNNKGNKFIKNGEIDVTVRGLKDAGLKLYPEGTVLMSSRAPVGYLAISTKEITTNQGFKSFIPDKKYGKNYIYYTLQNNLKVIEQHASGSTFKEISATVLKDITIIQPNLDIVKKFEEKVSSINSYIKVNEEQKQELTQVRDWLLPMLMNGQVKVE
ncbi:restriction endonuclease subunit S [Streptococcus thermophilus]|uniref:restriction endonuclease subunit S n=1 Tax=Streptococcus thermophilus TaxID=1308 RepID=UPI0021A3DC48|nr:restriction endonuclease subunit S [Streptococcus thermophilus]MCT2956408.1 restriction endonuclease subunit S [Streptococcus thermophilus]MEE0122382.1 restriction endonuclease subunit S [Streptococcus salivarius]MEE1509562.1 restriction endonuclease subunit S [Streptococcus thermophilus]